MDRYLKVLERYKAHFIGLPNVSGIGVGNKQVGMQRTNKPAIIVFVEKKKDATELTKDQIIPKKVGGLETDVIELGTVRLLGIRHERHRPAQPGISIGHQKVSAGTFGAVVRDVSTGERFILSNNHILANGSNGSDGRAEIGDAILQPASYDGGTINDKIGTLLRFAPLLRTTQEADCPVAAGVQSVGNELLKIIRPNYELKIMRHSRATNVIDAAVAKPDQLNLISEEIMEIGNIKGVAEAELGMMVQKSGRSSGLTKGEVIALGSSLKVELDSNEYGWFSDQIVCEAKVSPGDSGSLFSNEEHKAVGLLFAGSDKHGIFNRLANVLERLKVTF